MTRLIAIIVLAMTGPLALQGDVNPQTEPAHARPGDRSNTISTAQPDPLNSQQRELVDWAMGRFELQGLELPEIDFVFHADLWPCSGHKGRFHRSTQTLEMCSMDMPTMLHELAHAWANEHLTARQMNAFVSERDLASWNDHDDPWERRGTEHVAESIAWALAEDPHHVKWSEALADGSVQTTHRILTIDVDVDTLLVIFKDITGMDPIFRDPSEWADEEAAATSASPELMRLGG